MTRHALHSGSGRPAGQSRDSSGSRAPARAVAAADVDAGSRGHGCWRARTVGAPPGPAASRPARSLAAGAGGASGPAVSSVNASLPGRAACAPRERVPPCGAGTGPGRGRGQPPRGRLPGGADGQVWQGLRAQLPHPSLRAPCPRSRRPSLLETRLCSERHLRTCY